MKRRTSSPKVIGLPDYVRILPELVLSVFGMLIMLLEPFVDERRHHKILGSVALVILRRAQLPIVGRFFQPALMAQHVAEIAMRRQIVGRQLDGAQSSIGALPAIVVRRMSRTWVWS